jgi:ADP-ribose pyrophosphatase YjhB (NUDIX family)
VSNTAPKTEERDGKIIHFSVGAIVTNAQGQLLLVDRELPPPGFAGLAGHLDDGETPQQAIVREIQEESGLLAVDIKLVAEEFVPWNYCAAGVTGHHWYLFTATASGQPIPQLEEVKSVGWYEPAALLTLPLEEVWQHWFGKLGYL